MMLAVLRICRGSQFSRPMIVLQHYPVNDMSLLRHSCDTPPLPSILGLYNTVVTELCGPTSEDVQRDDNTNTGFNINCGVVD